MSSISSCPSFSSEAYVEDCAVDFLRESSIYIEDIKEELDGRSIRAALSTAGIRLKEHFKELNLVKGQKIDIEAFKKRLTVRHSWGSSVIIGW